ncbi:MAG: molybdopterin molybdenumtransferase MoeA, partial [Albidovulum sp.]|nr:molybdopterin molybdenumtransferase MoeA [Albidovulum sp.]
MIPVDDALARIFESLPKVEAEYVSIHDACGRVLSRRLVANRDQPPFDASAMDGYAVRKSDAKPRAELKIIGEVSAGEVFNQR